jgi:hypothetical protein
LARLGEFLLPCELAEQAGWISGFNAEFFGKHLVFYVLVFFAASTLFDLFEAAVAPDLAPPCSDDEPQLPLGGEQ